MDPSYPLLLKKASTQLSVFSTLALARDHNSTSFFSFFFFFLFAPWNLDGQRAKMSSRTAPVKSMDGFQLSCDDVDFFFFFSLYSNILPFFF
jgi:hypothetical protein